MRQLGGSSLYVTDAEIGFGKRESIYDIGQVTSRFLDGIMIRTFDQAKVVELAEAAPSPVINGLTDLEHPCQVLSDLLTVTEKGIPLDGIKVAYLGDGNNLVHSWLTAAMAFHFDFTFGGPGATRPRCGVRRAGEGPGQGEDRHLRRSRPRRSAAPTTDTWTTWARRPRRRSGPGSSRRSRSTRSSSPSPTPRRSSCMPPGPPGAGDHRRGHGRPPVGRLRPGGEPSPRAEGRPRPVPRGTDGLTVGDATGGRVRAAAAVLLALAACSCAQVEPPSGGPEDKEPPRVAVVYPESAGTGSARRQPRPPL